MRKFTVYFLLLVNYHLHAQQTFTSGGKLKPEQAIMDVRHYTIALNVDFDQKSIEGYTIIDVIMEQPAKILLFDLLDSLNVKQVLVNNKKEPFEYKNSLIRINLNNELPAGKASVKVLYGGKPHVAIRPPWDDGFIWSRDSTGHPWMAITAEGTGGKLYFPCKDRQYAVYVGVIPFDHTSGTSIKGRKRVSHLAHKELKSELNQAAKTAISHDPEIRIYAERKLKNKDYSLVLNNVKFKLILRMFSLVKRGEKYVENYRRSA